MDMNADYDVAVIGAGVTGAAIARRLSRYQLKVALIEKEVDVSFGTSKANSGIIHAGFHDQPGSLKATLCVRGNAEYDRLSEELGFPFERRGELVVAFNDEQEQVLQMLYRRGLENGVPYMEILGRERTLELEPNLNPDVQGALFAPTAGIVGPYEYCFALVENAVLNNVELMLSFKVSAIACEGNHKFRIEAEDGRSIKTAHVVNAAGLFADDVAGFAGVSGVKITPRKGEEYLLDRRVGSLVSRVVFPAPTPTSKGILIIPTIDGPVMIGPTAVDTDDKNDMSTSKPGLDKVFEFANHLVPSIRIADIITSFAGIRPVPEGDDFIIGESEIPGFINAAGIQSPGLTASPAIAERVCDILLASGLGMKLKKDFKPKRESTLRIRKLVETRDYTRLADAISTDKDYSSLVCRCETVSKAEIIAAIRAGHVTLDAIKYATRAGTGRCQGGFCTSRIMKLIEEYAPMNAEDISKKGPGSEIVVGRVGKGGAK
jgi:glycerol-3-phosphate dehydrogenase